MQGSLATGTDYIGLGTISVSRSRQMMGPELGALVKQEERMVQGLLDNYQHFNCFGYAKISKEMGGLKNEESAVLLSLLRIRAFGILLFMVNVEGVCASSN